MSDPESDLYPRTWEADVVLTDGHTVHIRPIVAADAEALVRFHSRQSPESIYLRYFSPRPKLTERDIRHFTQVDHTSRVAFVALADSEIVGIARYEAYKGTDVAEVAFFVDDLHNGRGLATLLLEYLVAAARERGIRRFTATTLPTNQRMLAVFSAAGYRVSSNFDAGVVEIAFDIGPTLASRAAINRRERLAEAASVRKLLEPSTVAVVGAGRGGRGLGAKILRNIIDNGFTGVLYPVNRHSREIDGLPALVDVSELPDGIDLAILAIPADAVVDVVERCGERGIRAVMIVSAGFSEAGRSGAQLEAAVVNAARRHGMRLLGPNCLGLLNTDPSVSLDASLSPVLPRSGSVGVLTETGTLAAAMVDHAARVDLGVSTFVAGGNRADVGAGDLLSYWLEDDRTGSVLLSLATRDPLPRFVRAARAASLSKPIAALHTRHLSDQAGARTPERDRRAQAMFRQTGIINVGTLEQLFDLGRILGDQPVPSGSGVAVVGNSDGAVMLAADACTGAGLELVDVGVTSRDGKELRNPVDLTFQARVEDLRDALRSLANHDGVHSIIVVHTPPDLKPDPAVGDVILDCSRDNPDIAVVATMLGAAGRGRLVDDAGSGVPIFRFPEDAANALGRLARYRQWHASASGSDPADTLAPSELEAASAIISTARGESTGWVNLDHDAQRELLAVCGLGIASRRVVTTVDEAVTGAEEIGWPVVLKAAVRDRSTRAIASGVSLDIAGESHLRLIWDQMVSAIGQRMVPAVVQEFIPSGVDIAVIVKREAGGAGTVEVGLGGPAAIIGDTELGVLPLSLSDASALVARSAVARVLTDPIYRVAVVGLVNRLGALAESLDMELDLRADPVIVSRGEAWVADVDVRVGDPVEDFGVRRLETDLSGPSRNLA